MAIILIALIVLGPHRIPGVARSLARLYKEFTKVRRHADSAVEDIKKELQISDEDLLGESPALRPPEGERAVRSRVPLDQAAIMEQLELQQVRDLAGAAGGRPPRPYGEDALPVPELDDYLGTGKEPRA